MGRLRTFQRPGDERLYITDDDNRRYCQAMLALTHPFGGDAERFMRYALERNAPRSGDVETAIRYFGTELPLIQEMLAPLINAIEEMLPDFVLWIGVMGFAQDKDFIVALQKLHAALSALPPPKGSDKQNIFRSIADTMPVPAVATKH